ncbi:hypothetical protein [Aeropyrum camini]|uniref:hypothetical protein n=1 Tax=Aeropyrum camini TaxID=229980 RepID=UPI000786BF97|nr:hypothetical protein [Aeropyrum camini]
MGRIVIVYHEPGDPASVKLVEDLASRLEDRLGVRVVTVQMKDVESRGAKAFNSGDTVVSLLPARGGHLHTVAEAAKRAGAKHVGPIPPSLTARL